MADLHDNDSFCNYIYSKCCKESDKKSLVITNNDQSYSELSQQHHVDLQDHELMINRRIQLRECINQNMSKRFNFLTQKFFSLILSSSIPVLDTVTSRLPLPC
jgi:hypothetical protein